MMSARARWVYVRTWITSRNVSQTREMCCKTWFGQHILCSASTNNSV